MKILIVDDEPKTLKILERFLVQEDTEVIKAENGVSALKKLEDNNIDLIITDVMMPQMNGFELCTRVKSDPNNNLLPIIMITAIKELDYRLKGLKCGADDFISKPLNMNELIIRVRSLLHRKEITDQMDSATNILKTLNGIVASRDTYTSEHSLRVGRLAEDIGMLMGLTPDVLSDLKKGAELHDIGKIGVSDSLLHKSGSLTNEEYAAVKKHPVIGYEICKHLNSTKGLLTLIRHHHEKLDGSGYPDGLKGDEITTPTRIICIVDIYDALTSDRPYRKSMSSESAFVIIDGEVEKGKLTREIVHLLKNLVSPDYTIQAIN